MPVEKHSLKVFLCHAHSDVPAVRDLYSRLKRDGVDVWLDKEKLLPGADWELEIRKAVREADIVIVCLSKQFNQAGFRQKEVRLALDTAMEQPEGEIFIIPARLEECDTLESLRKWHWVDLFEDDGYKRLISALRARANKLDVALQSTTSELPWATPQRKSKKPTSEKKTAEAKQNKSTETAKSEDKTKSRRKPNTAITVALISLAGTIIAALLNSQLILKWLSPEGEATRAPTIVATAGSIAPPYFPPLATSYDFVSNMCSATWSSSTGQLVCPGQNSDTNDFVTKVGQPASEDGISNNPPSLLVVLPAINNGFIQGVYPEYRVKEGDRFNAKLACESEATSCRVQYRLDYQISGERKTFRSFSESYDSLTDNVNLDLSPLTGMTVKFILYISAWGSPIGDRALWISPAISNPNGQSNCTDWAKFDADVTIPDGTIFAPGEKFTKTMRFQNIGTCTWTPAYALVFDSGTQMGGSTSISLTGYVLPGQYVDLAVDLQAPSRIGHYIGYWKLRNAAGATFGIGANANRATWVDINVTYPVIGVTATP